MTRIVLALSAVFFLASVGAAAPPDPAALAAKIDARIDEKLKAEGVKPAAPAPDAEFLRRASLDVLGRIPTVAETRAFLDDQSPDKRAKLIDKLVANPAAINHAATVWRYALVPQAALNPRVQFINVSLEEWLRAELRAGRRADELVRDLLTAPLDYLDRSPDGKPRPVPGPSPLGFYQANDLKPETVASSAARVLLGIKIECAQSGASSGYLGPDYAPLLVGANPDGPNGRRPGVRDLAVQDIKPAVESDRANDRVKMLEELNAEFAPGHEGGAVASVQSAYERGLRLMNGSASAAFHFDDEPEKVRAAYGATPFGQGCLLARRLVEKGVPFVEVTLAGGFGGTWDTHGNNFERVKTLCATLDPAWAVLIADLKDKGLLETTTVAWMGEFGRTPRINGNAGRDHYWNAWDVVLGGGGIKGGQVYGKTDKAGGTVEDKAASVPDLLATICKAIGVDPAKQNISNIGRPIRIVEKDAKPMTEVLA